MPFPPIIAILIIVGLDIIASGITGSIRSGRSSIRIRTKHIEKIGCVIYGKPYLVQFLDGTSIGRFDWTEVYNAATLPLVIVTMTTMMKLRLRVGLGGCGVAAHTRVQS